MNFKIIYGAIFLIVAIYCFSTWRKSRSKDFFWLTWLGIIGFLDEVINYFLENSFRASREIISIGNSFIIIFTPILIVSVVWILAKGWRKK